MSLKRNLPIFYIRPQLDWLQKRLPVRALEGGFTWLDRSVLHTMTEWLQRQLQQGAFAELQRDGSERSKNESAESELKVDESCLGG